MVNIFGNANLCGLSAVQLNPNPMQNLQFTQKLRWSQFAEDI